MRAARGWTGSPDAGSEETSQNAQRITQDNTRQHKTTRRNGTRHRHRQRGSVAAWQRQWTTLETARDL
eukprot:762883-Rhodomonas_salina.1